jgi:hypothetical protein
VKHHDANFLFKLNIDLLSPFFISMLGFFLVYVSYSDAYCLINYAYYCLIKTHRNVVRFHPGFKRHLLSTIFKFFNYLKTSRKKYTENSIAIFEQNLFYFLLLKNKESLAFIISSDQFSIFFRSFTHLTPRLNSTRSLSTAMFPLSFKSTCPI